jgi:hypothetical protein
LYCLAADFTIAARASLGYRRRMQPRRGRVLAGLGLLVLISVPSACKKEPSAETPDAALAATPPQPKVPTVTRYAADELSVFSAADSGTPLEGVHVDVLGAVEVVATDAGRSAYYVDGKAAGYLETDHLLTERPSTDASLKALVAALARGDSEDALMQAARAMVTSPDAGMPVRVRAALEERRGALSPATKKRLDALGAPAAQPAFPPLKADAKPLVEGTYVWPVSRDLVLRAAPKADAKPLADLALDAPLELVTIQGEWAEVRQTPAENTATPAPDAGESDDAGEPADAGAASPLQGFVPKAAVMTEHFMPDNLVVLAQEHESEGRLASAARARELASALAPDSNELLVGALEADLAAGRVKEAIALADRKPDLSFLKNVSLELLLGCRGKKAKAEATLDPEKLPKKLPANACVSEPEYDACVTCWQPSTDRDAKRRLRDGTNLRESLHKRFPDGPFVRAEISSPGPSGLSGFFYEVPYEYEQGRCDEYLLHSDPAGAKVSEPFALPKPGGDGVVHWYEPTSDTAVYGFMVAHSADDVRRALVAFGKKDVTGLPQLAPDPNVAKPIDTCPDCNGCGD